MKLGQIPCNKKYFVLIFFFFFGNQLGVTRKEVEKRYCRYSTSRASASIFS